MNNQGALSLRSYLKEQARRRQKREKLVAMTARLIGELTIDANIRAELRPMQKK